MVGECGEELMAQVDRHALVPVLGRDLLESATIIVRRVVDEDAHGAQSVLHLAQRALQGIDVAQVAGQEERRLARAIAKLRHECASRLFGHVEEGDTAALSYEVAHEGLTYPGRTTGDEDDALTQVGVEDGFGQGWGQRRCAWHGIATQARAAARP